MTTYCSNDHDQLMALASRANCELLGRNPTDAPVGQNPSLVTHYEAVMGEDQLWGIHKVWRRPSPDRRIIMRSGRIDLDHLRRTVDLI